MIGRETPVRAGEVLENASDWMELPRISLCAPKGVYHQWRKNPPR